jgi:hypothetical protein
MPCSAEAAGNAPDSAKAAGLVAAGAASPGAAFRAASGAQIKKALAIMSLSDCILPQQIHPPNSTSLFSRSSGRKLKDTAETLENHKHFLGNSHTNFARLSRSSLGKILLEHPRPGCRSIPAAKFRHSAKLYWCDERAGARTSSLFAGDNFTGRGIVAML